MNAVKAVIFDMDGLLVDSEIHYSQGWINAAQRVGIELNKTITDSWVGQGKQATIDYLEQLTNDSKCVETIVTYREEYIYECLELGLMELCPKAKETLTEIHQRGIKIVVASSTARKRARHILEALQLWGFIDASVFGDEVEMVKPSPEIYQKALATLSLNVEDVIAVEDSYSGAQAATRAGIRTVVIPSFAFDVHELDFHDKVIAIEESLESLLSYIES